MSSFQDTTPARYLSFTYLRLCESDCESIKINFTDGLVTQFLFEWSCNDLSEAPDVGDGVQNSLCDWPQARVRIEQMPVLDNFPEYFDPEMTDWRPNETSPQPRPRPSYSGHTTNLTMFKSETRSEHFMDCMIDLQKQRPGYTDMANICYSMVVLSQKDISWQRALQSEDAAEIITSLETEMESLLSTILTEIFPDDHEFEEALKLATPGRLILSTRRTGKYKARGVNTLTSIKTL